MLKKEYENVKGAPVGAGTPFLATTGLAPERRRQTFVNTILCRNPLYVNPTSYGVNMEHTNYTFGPDARFAWLRSLTLPPSIKTTLYIMLQYTDSRTGETVISHSTLARKVGKLTGKPAPHRRTMMRHQKELERLRLIERQPRQARNGCKAITIIWKMQSWNVLEPTVTQGKKGDVTQGANTTVNSCGQVEVMSQQMSQPVSQQMSQQMSHNPSYPIPSDIPSDIPKDIPEEGANVGFTNGEAEEILKRYSPRLRAVFEKRVEWVNHE